MATISLLKAGIKKLVGPMGRHLYCETRDAFARPRFATVDVDYEEYWRKREFIAVQPRYPIMCSIVQNGDSLLDIGCGDGGFLAYVKSRKSVTELGIDISKTAVQLTRSRGANARVCSVFELGEERKNVSGRFNVVVISEVIEHVANSEELIRAAWELTGDTLIISFPNIAYWPHRLRLMFGRNPIQWAYFQGEHLRFWSVPDFVEWLHALRLPSAKVSGQVIATTGTRPLNLYKYWPNLFGNQILVVVSRNR